MTKQSLIPTLLLVVLFATVVSSYLTVVSELGGMVGGRTKVEQVKTNDEVQDLGKFSVQQFNRMQKEKKNGGGYGGELRFQEVVEAEKQVVSGIKYYLKITAVTRDGVPNTFEAVVLVKPWSDSKELLNFHPSPATK